MAIEHARARLLPKPWGIADVRPWSIARHDDQKIGEIWYERSSSQNASLLLKLLFTDKPLSVQVHPDDVFAQALGLPRGKTEAWYVLGAAPGAKVALGLNRYVTPQQLREAAGNGSIANLLEWRAVSPGDVLLVPAGTIHAIGAGLIIAELQQNSDATFRLFDYGSERELHIESAVAVATAGPAEFQVRPTRVTEERTLLVSSPHFVLEKIDLPPNSRWRLEVDRETWILALNGDAQTGSFDITTGDAVFAEADCLELDTGSTRFVGLVAHTGAGHAPELLQVFKERTSGIRESREESLPTPLVQGHASTGTRLVETAR